MTFLQIQSILSNVRYKDWKLIVSSDEGGRLYLQWFFHGPCVLTGLRQSQQCRKHWLSHHMTESELVQTAFAAALQAEEHECREFFHYKGHRPFHPHIPIDRLMVASLHVDERT